MYVSCLMEVKKLYLVFHQLTQLPVQLVSAALNCINLSTAVPWFQNVGVPGNAGYVQFNISGGHIGDTESEDQGTVVFGNRMCVLFSPMSERGPGFRSFEDTMHISIWAVSCWM